MRESVQTHYCRYKPCHHEVNSAERSIGPMGNCRNTANWKRSYLKNKTSFWFSDGLVFPPVDTKKEEIFSGPILYESATENHLWGEPFELFCIFEIKGKIKISRFCAKFGKSRIRKYLNFAGVHRWKHSFSYFNSPDLCNKSVLFWKTICRWGFLPTFFFIKQLNDVSIVIESYLNGLIPFFLVMSKCNELGAGQLRFLFLATRSALQIK